MAAPRTRRLTDRHPQLVNGVYQFLAWTILTATLAILTVATSQPTAFTR